MTNTTTNPTSTGQRAATYTFESTASKARKGNALHLELTVWRQRLGYVPTSEEILAKMDEIEARHG